MWSVGLQPKWHTMLFWGIQKPVNDIREDSMLAMALEIPPIFQMIEAQPRASNPPSKITPCRLEANWATHPGWKADLAHPLVVIHTLIFYPLLISPLIELTSSQLLQVL